MGRDEEVLKFGHICVLMYIVIFSVMSNFLKFIFLLFLVFSGLIVFVIIYYFFKFQKDGSVEKYKEYASKKVKEISKDSDFKKLQKEFPKDLKNAHKEVQKDLKKAKKIVDKEVKEVRKLLSERQEQIMDFIDKVDEMAVSDIVQKFKEVTPRTLRRDLEKLENLGFVKQIGKTKDSKYKKTKS